MGAGGPIYLEKEGSEITVKKFSPFSQASGSPQDPSVVPTRSGIQETLSNMCKSNSCVHQGEFQLILGIPYFPKPDSQQSKGVSVEVGEG